MAISSVMQIWGWTCTLVSVIKLEVRPYFDSMWAISFAGPSSANGVFSQRGETCRKPLGARAVY
jgi:hypothetical protein